MPKKSPNDPSTRKEMRKIKKQAKKSKNPNYIKNKMEKQQAIQVQLQMKSGGRGGQGSKRTQQKRSNDNTQAIGKSNTNININTNTSRKIQSNKFVSSNNQPDYDQQMIQYYSNKLKINKGNQNKEGLKIAEEMGMDGDLFQFLDGIIDGKKGGKKGVEKNGGEQQVGMEGFDQEADNDGQQSQQFEQDDQSEGNQMEDQEGQNQSQRNNIVESSQQGSNQIIAEDQSIESNQSHPNSPNQANTFKILQLKLNVKPTPNRSLNNLFNRLSDNTLPILYPQFVQILNECHQGTSNDDSTLSLSIHSTSFQQLFMSFNLVPQRPFLHLMAANVALVVALGENWITKVLTRLTKAIFIGTNSERGGQKKVKDLKGSNDRSKDNPIQTTPNPLSSLSIIPNQTQIEQLGYCRVEERRKNYIVIIALFYVYGGIEATMVASVVQRIVKEMNVGNVGRVNIISNTQSLPQSPLHPATHYLQLLYILIQRCGSHLRHNDPSTLKQIIDLLKVGLANVPKETPKLTFLQKELEDLKFNKKKANDERLSFLEKWIQSRKGVRIGGTIDDMLDQQKKPEQKVSNNQKDSTHQNNTGIKSTQLPTYMIPITASSTASPSKTLIALAKHLHFNTQRRSRLFLELMSSNDALQAASRLVNLKGQQQHDAATVIVATCMSQDQYNPFYAAVASRISISKPGYRRWIQGAIWDQLKQFKGKVNFYQTQQDNVRANQPIDTKLSHLACFSGQLVAKAPCFSLSVLRFFPDLYCLNGPQLGFVIQLLRFFLKKSTHSRMVTIVGKLQVKANRLIRDGLRQLMAAKEKHIAWNDQQMAVKVRNMRKLLEMIVARGDQEDEGDSEQEGNNMFK